LFDAFGHVEIEGFEEKLTLPKRDLTQSLYVDSLVYIFIEQLDRFRIKTIFDCDKLN